MADSLASDLNKFSNQIEKIIGVYYNLLNENNNEKYSPLKKNECEKWCSQILSFLNNYIKNKEKVTKIILDQKNAIESFYEKLKKTKNKCIEFYIIINTCQLLFEIYFDKKLPYRSKTNADHYEKHMSRWIAKEIINLRNEIGHNENPSLELILRFYQDQFFYLKYIKPKNINFRLDNYALEDIKLNIQIYLAKNIEFKDSFDLDLLKNKEKYNENEKNSINISEENKQKMKESILSLYNNYPLKLPEFKFNILDENDKKELNDKKNKENKENKEEDDKSEKHDNEKEDIKSEKKENEKNVINDIDNVSQDEIESFSITHEQSESNDSIDEFEEENQNICEETQKSLNMTNSNDTYIDYQKNS